MTTLPPGMPPPLTEPAPLPPSNGNGKGRQWWDKKYNVQALLFIALLIVDGYFGWQLKQELGNDRINEAIAALYGTVIGAVTLSLGLAGKDLFRESD